MYASLHKEEGRRKRKGRINCTNFESFVLSDKGMSFSSAEVSREAKKKCFNFYYVNSACLPLFGALLFASNYLEVSTLQLFNMVGIGDYVNSDSSSLLLFSSSNILNINGILIYDSV